MISKINNTFVDNAEELNIVMPIYVSLEYSYNYSMTWGSVWNYYIDKVNDCANENNDTINYRTSNNKIIKSKSFGYKTKITGRTPDDDDILDTEVVGTLKYLNNFWDFLICFCLTVK